MSYKKESNQTEEKNQSKQIFFPLSLIFLCLDECFVVYSLKKPVMKVQDYYWQKNIVLFL